MDNLSGIDYHTIQVACDSAFGALVDSARRTDTTCTRILPADTSYYWRVRATESCANAGPWSEAWRLEIDTVGVAEQPERLPAARLECLPNPSSGRTTVRLTLPSPANAAVVIYDAAGVRVGTLWAGRHDFRWDARAAAGRTAGPGVYFARATADGWTSTGCLRFVR